MLRYWLPICLAVAIGLSGCSGSGRTRPLLTVTSERTEYVEGQRIRYRVEAIDTIDGKPTTVIARLAGNEVILVRGSDGSLGFVSDPVRYGSDYSLDVQVLAEPYSEEDGLGLGFGTSREKPDAPGKPDKPNKEKQLKARASVRPIVIRDIEPPQIVDLMIRDDDGRLLGSDALSVTKQVYVSWRVVDNGAPGSSFKMKGSPKQFTFTGNGDGSYSAVIDASKVEEDTVDFEIIASDFKNHTVKQSHGIRIDRLAPRLDTNSQNCVVEHAEAKATLRGHLEETNLARFEVRQFSSTHPEGLVLQPDWHNKLYSVKAVLDSGDNFFQIEATDVLGRVSTVKIQRGHYPLGTSANYDVAAVTEDGRSIEGTISVNGSTFSVPGQVTVAGSTSFQFQAADAESPTDFSATLDAGYKYTYSVSSNTLTPVKDGCIRLLKIIYPNVIPLPVTSLAAEDPQGTSVPDVMFEYRGQTVIDGRVQVPSKQSFDLAVKYGASIAAARIEGGTKPDETVYYNVVSRQLQRVATPGQRRVVAVLEPGALQIEKRSLDGKLLSPVTSVKGIIGANFIASAQYGEFTHAITFPLKSRTDYEFAGHGGRFFSRPTPQGENQKMVFFFELTPVDFTAVDQSGMPVACAFRVSGSTLSGLFPTQLSLGLSTGAEVEVYLNGFARARKVRVFEDEILKVDLSSGQKSKIYSFKKPGLQFVVRKQDLTIECVDATGVLAGAKAGVVEGPDSTVGSITVPGLQGTSGRVFCESGTNRVEIDHRLEPDTLTTVDTRSGAISRQITSGESRVRFVY